MTNITTMRSLITIVSNHHHHHHSSSSSDKLTIVTMKSPKWLNRIRRRSGERQQLVVEQQHNTYDDEMQELTSAYEFALDELAYAVESQGSIYYYGDRETAQEAFDSCVNRYRCLMDQSSDAERVKLAALYHHALEDLNTELSKLP